MRAKTQHGIPTALWLVIWRRGGYRGRIERDVYLSEGGAKRAIRALEKLDPYTCAWFFNQPMPFKRSAQHKCATKEGT